jgi:hypothetical protein
MPDATTILRDAIGTDVVIGVAVTMHLINEITGRVREVDGGRVRLDDPSLRDRGTIDRARVAKHAGDWGIRIADIRWVRVGDTDVVTF